jgi:hypothetical protein
MMLVYLASKWFLVIKSSGTHKHQDSLRLGAIEQEFVPSYFKYELNRKKNIPSVWYTLVGLKLLKQNFDREKTVWNLIARKARKALHERLGFTGDLETILGQLKIGNLTHSIAKEPRVYAS